jgi:hypothetical protein
MSTRDDSQEAYRRTLTNAREVVFWQLDDGRQPWQFDADDEAPPAPDWFFVVNHPRTGSSVVHDLLNAHPMVYCGYEHHVLPLFMTLLGSQLFMSQRLWKAVRYQKRVQITPRHMRHLLDAWRRCVSDRPLFGDKGEMYLAEFGPACEKVFPGCKLLLTVRHPLDTLSSYLRQSWGGYMFLGNDPRALNRNLRVRAYRMLAGNRAWRDKARVIEFERMATRDGFTAVFGAALEHLGAPAADFDWETAWARCKHAPAVGRWEKDATMTTFLRWLGREDPPLHDLLQGGAYYLPDGQELPTDLDKNPGV